MTVQIKKGMFLRMFVYSLLTEYTFKTQIFEFETDLIYDYDPNIDFSTIHKLLQLELNVYNGNKESVIDGQQIIDNIFESFYKKIFDYFINNYIGNIDDWEQGFFIVEIQALDWDRNIVFQTEGFDNYNTIEGHSIL